MNGILLRAIVVAVLLGVGVVGGAKGWTGGAMKMLAPALAAAQDAGGGVAANDTVAPAKPVVVPARADSLSPPAGAVPASALVPADTLAPALVPAPVPATDIAPPASVARPPATTVRIKYSTPGDLPLPREKFAGMRETLVFSHFPNPVSASLDPGQPGLNIWKHNTAVMSETENVTIEEAGSYIYYNDQWNLRATFTPEEFAEMFACPGAVLKAGQPYTWAQNWRTDERLYGGWACYYAIGVMPGGERVYGTGPIETTGFYYFAEDEWAVRADSSSAGWTGGAAFTDFTISGTLDVVSGEVVVRGFDVLRGEIIFDMASIASDVEGISAHLMNADFFEAETYPYAVFKLTDPVALSMDGGTARGELTLKGVTKSVDVKFEKLFIRDDEGMGVRMEARGETTIDRTDFGVTYGSIRFFPDAGERAIADDIVFRFDLKLTKVLERESANNSR